MPDIGKTIGTTANVGIILVAILASVVFVRNHLLKPKDLAGNRNVIKLSGTKLTIPDIDWTKNNQTLLFVLSKDCRYCTESASFYQRIAGNEKIKSKTKLVAVFPDPESEGAEYLKQLSVPIEQIKQIPLNILGVQGTPTLLLVDSSGVVKSAWRGKIPASRESEVINILQ